MKKHIVVIGGGVIGLSTAYALIQSGHKVTLVEANDQVGCQTSYANGGQLSYRYVAPLADAGVPIQALQWLGKAHSPLNFKLNISPFQWSWLLQFLFACNRKDNVVNGNHILRLSLYSQTIMKKWRNQLDDFCWVKSGKMVIHRDEQTFKKASANIDPTVQQVLNSAETVAIEPALKGIESELAGSIFTPDDETADCYKFCLALYKAMEPQADFECLYEHKVTDFFAQDNKISALETSQKRIEADEFVVAAGNGSTAIFDLAGISVPLYPLKGYSLTVPFPKKLHAVPSISVTDYANKIVYAKLGDRLRVAAMVDIGYQHVDIRKERMAALKHTVKKTFPDLDGVDTAIEWSGLRPSTPKGPPILGRTKYSNLWSNVGQGSLGFTLAAGSAMVIAELISNAESPIHLEGLCMRKCA
ncbi:D-amino acid dehydrogenase [Acinetobacter sp. ANC 3813]|uniref:D-amino acid dehydrogenase n=1 Tax=Acinetobacter sp. ANC 3813 TaxID=1977873 RepID=UPI000A34BD5D|nr:D-amino acid dehydrogenase [Acinetobacter sp. ANC 3813]OTG87348.1 amino acid dehydrogenase [Acinetobacter sp. ANC 3813]